MRLAWIGSLTGLEALRPRWGALWEVCPRATPFQSPEWLIGWTRHLFGGGEICCGTIEDDGYLVAVAPFFIYGTEERTLAFLGAGISDYGDLLALPGRERECAELVREWIAHQPVRCDLREIPDHSALLGGGEPQCSVCPVLEVVNFEERLSPKLRNDLKRARNRLVKQHEYAFGCGGEEYLDALFRLHEARWQQEQKPGVLNSAALRAFHKETASAFQQRGLLRIYVLKVDGEIRAVIYGFVAGTRFYSYLSGFDPAYARLSCGALLLRHAIEHTAMEGLLEFDFLREPEAYKYEWGARDRINYSFEGKPLEAAAASRA